MDEDSHTYPFLSLASFLIMGYLRRWMKTSWTGGSWFSVRAAMKISSAHTSRAGK
jgi:hypothetical protein